MITPQLLDYIKQQTQQGTAKETIISTLIAQGWQQVDVDAGFVQVESGASIVPAPMEVKYAGFWIRYVANVIDSLVLAIPQMIVGVIMGVGGVSSKSSFPMAISMLVTWIYFIFMTEKYQATLGKRAVGIRVVSDNSEKLTLGQIILRETIGKLVSMVILGIGYIMAGFTARKQALHDKIASTVVVYDDPNKKTPVWIFIVALVLPAIAIVGLLASIVLVSLSSARAKAVEKQFQAEASSVVPGMLIACDENNIITLKELGSPKQFDPSAAFRALKQDCTAADGASFSVTINGIDKASSLQAICTENGCTFK